MPDLTLPTPQTSRPQLTRFDPTHEDLPDPAVVAVPGGYFVYATNTHPAAVRPEFPVRLNVPVLFSRDLTEFTLLGDALPILPDWAEAGYTWAPDVTRVQGGYRMYFTTRKAGAPFPGGQVIGVATGRTPSGPFTPVGPPLTEMTGLGGAIDAASLRTRAGQHYLYWKSDGNAIGLSPVLWGAPLCPDGLTLQGEPMALLSASEPWEHDLIEAPQVIEEHGRYHLFYSCADFGDASYAVGHAIGDTPLGPFVKTRAAPVLSSYDGCAGPGHSCAFKAQDGHWHLAYHGWATGKTGYPDGQRSLHHGALDLDGPVPVIRPA